MAETSALDLNFGHLGIATYDLENSDWTFSRDPQQKWFSELGSWRVSVPPARLFSTPYPGKSTQRVHQATKSLIRHYAHIAPAAEHLPSLEIVSAAATSAAEAYDAVVGDLLSSGTIVCRGHRHHQPKEVVATATGEAGNILRLQVISKQRYGWGDEGKGAWLEAPSLYGNDCGYWNEEAAPIQQICFAQTDERSSFLAVRLLSRTVLFQPTYVHQPKASCSRYFNLPPSNINLNLILSVTIEETGNVSHAHVSFNPDYQRQFGLVDQSGNWSIWDIDDGVLHWSKYSLSCSARGAIVSAEGDHDTLDKSGNTGSEDGWARIMWVGDANTIMVANRRQLRLFNFKKGSIALNCPELVPAQSADWILDIKRHPENEKYAFVLTSTRLLMLFITCPSNDFASDNDNSGAAIIVSWLHYRSPEDITLQMCAEMSADDDCFLIMHSSLNYLTTLYCFSGTSSGEGLQPVTSDPVEINIDGLRSMDMSIRPREMRFEHLNYAKSQVPPEQGLGDLYKEHNVQFYRLSVMMTDLSMRESLFYSTNDIKQRRLRVEAISWVKTHRAKPCSRKITVDESDVRHDFMVPNSLMDSESPRLKRPQVSPKIIPRRTQPNPWYVFDHNTLYHALIDDAVTIGTGSLLGTRDLFHAIEEVSKLQIGYSSLDQPPLGTLIEYVNSEIIVSDVVEASAGLLQIFSAEHGERILQLRRIASDDVLGLTETDVQDTSTILSLYDTILKSWLAPLPSHVPVPIRQGQERLARRIAAEVVLSSTRFRHDSSEKLESSQTLRKEHEPDPLSNIVTPPSSLNLLLPPLESPLPMISENAPPSRSKPEPQPDPLKRLSKHLRIDKASTGKVPLGIAQVLTHWRTGTNPKDYDWDAMEEAIQEDVEAEDAETRAKRERARRKKERHEKRQKREADLFNHRTSSQPQILRSSPGPSFALPSRAVPSSQTQSQSQSQTFPELVVQSQVEPGKHGSRAQKKKKKGKARMSGF